MLFCKLFHFFNVLVHSLKGVMVHYCILCVFNVNLCMSTLSRSGLLVCNTDCLLLVRAAASNIPTYFPGLHNSLGILMEANCSISNQARAKRGRP